MYKSNYTTVQLEKEIQYEWGYLRHEITFCWEHLAEGNKIEIPLL